MPVVPHSLMGAASRKVQSNVVLTPSVSAYAQLLPPAFLLTQDTAIMPTGLVEGSICLVV